MTHYVIKEMQHPIKDIKVDLGKDLPLWRYIQMAVQDIEVINELGLHPINDDVAIPFIHVVNWKWNPHPLSQDIEYKRRETGDRIPTKPIGNIRLGILEFDIYCGAKDKNRRLETHCVHNKIYVPIEDDQGKYLVDSTKYSEYQIVDKLLYPAGRNTVILKSLLPIVISYDEIEWLRYSQRWNRYYRVSCTSLRCFLTSTCSQFSSGQTTLLMIKIVIITSSQSQEETFISRDTRKV